MKPDRMFALAGLCSALITLALGAFWLAVMVWGAGLIFSVVLLSADSILHHRLDGPRISFPKKLLTAAVVTFSYLCGVLVFVIIASSLDHVGMELRNSIAVTIAAIGSAFPFYWALRISKRTTDRMAFIWLLILAISSALVAVAWGEHFVVLRPGWFISPFWVSLLVIGETGFAWVWGRSVPGGPRN